MDYYDMSYRSEDMHYFDVYVPGIAEVWETCLWPSLAQIAQYMVTFFIWNLAFRATSQTCKSNGNELFCLCKFRIILHILINIHFFLLFSIFSTPKYSNQPNHLHTNAHSRTCTHNSVDIPRPCQHIASIVCGIALSHFTLGLDFMYSLIFTAIEYILLLAVTRANLKNYGVILTVFCLTTLVIGFVFLEFYLTEKLRLFFFTFHSPYTGTSLNIGIIVFRK